MLLTEKMQQYPFSPSEKTIIQFLLDKQERIEVFSVKQIAEVTFTAPSSLIRIAHKLGFSGWKTFKKAFIKEIEYLHSHFQYVNANIPFHKGESLLDIASKITYLHTESAKDTIQLIDYQQLEKAVHYIVHAKEIKVFAIANLNFIAQEFTFKCNRIGIKASVTYVQDIMFHDALLCDASTCAICLSYSGETPHLLEVVEELKKRNVPIIALTSIGTNHLSSLADCVLHLSTREKSYSKIGAFTSLESFSLVLDILYSCVFSYHYDENLQYKIDTAKQVETKRIIDNQIITEK